LNIQSRPFFKPGHEQKPFLPFVQQVQSPETNPFPNASKWHRFGFNLPSSVSLTEEEQETVIQAVLSTLESWG
jgi:dTDP-4-amino-4,6-dideoxygalactose transaminase